jgi:hypothetical protein
VHQQLRSSFALLLEVNYVAHHEGGVTFDACTKQFAVMDSAPFGISTPHGGTDGPVWADAKFLGITTHIVFDLFAALG